MGIQYRWCLIYYHCTEEMCRTVDTVWYDCLETCKQAAEDLDFDFCCGYAFEYEERLI